MHLRQMVGLLHAAMDSGILSEDSVFLQMLLEARRGTLSQPGQFWGNSSFAIPSKDNAVSEAIKDVKARMNWWKPVLKAMRPSKFYWTEILSITDGRTLTPTLILDKNGTSTLHPALKKQGYAFFQSFYGGHAFLRQAGSVRSTFDDKWQPLSLGTRKNGTANTSTNSTAISLASNSTKDTADPNPPALRARSVNTTFSSPANVSASHPAALNPPINRRVNVRYTTPISEAEYLNGVATAAGAEDVAAGAEGLAAGAAGVAAAQGVAAAENLAEVVAIEAIVDRMLAAAAWGALLASGALTPMPLVPIVLGIGALVAGLYVGFELEEWLGHDEEFFVPNMPSKTNTHTSITPPPWTGHALPIITTSIPPRHSGPVTTYKLDLGWGWLGHQHSALTATDTALSRHLQRPKQPGHQHSTGTATDTKRTPFSTSTVSGLGPVVVRPDANFITVGDISSGMTVQTAVSLMTAGPFTAILTSSVTVESPATQPTISAA
ncbi:hypothetical protein TI39_contig5875g00003 [Zymoseptoria brevis]|uniref:Uncharacterized protein n=1 Tax=Zymoseptoria brevis TaxID=1047168 RepID=A0A0F4G4L2_9PEZI|nr:hypothetical protein TI39_contig5875g00003 [Zymoseptoria brevis]